MGHRECRRQRQHHPGPDVDDAHTFLDSMGQMVYDYGASAPAVAVADQASAQDKLLDAQDAICTGHSRTNYGH
jgi:hypothetical protein